MATGGPDADHRTTVLVAARGAAVRDRLASAVAGSRGLRLLTGAAGVPLVRQVATLHPDVVVIELDGDRLDPVLHSLPDASRAALVVLAESPSRAWREMAGARARAHAVLPRDATTEEIRAAIEAAAAGLVALHPAALAATARRARLPGLPARAEPDQRLTAREIEVLGMMADGFGNKIIAARLGISAHTAKFHVASIMAKLGAGSRTEAVSIGLRRGFLAI